MLVFFTTSGTAMQMLTISSRFLLVNASGEPLQCAQQYTTSIWQLQPDCVAPFHWADNSQRFEVCIRPALGSWTWSGAFKVTLVLKPSTGRHNLACKRREGSFWVLTVFDRFL